MITLAGGFALMFVLFAVLAGIFGMIGIDAYDEHPWVVSAIMSLIVAVASALTAIWLAVAGF